MTTDPSGSASNRRLENGIRISPNQPSSVIRVSRSQCVFHEIPLGPLLELISC